MPDSVRLLAAFTGDRARLADQRLLTGRSIPIYPINPLDLSDQKKAARFFEQPILETRLLK